MSKNALRGSIILLVAVSLAAPLLAADRPATTAPDSPAMDKAMARALSELKVETRGAPLMMNLRQDAPFLREANYVAYLRLSVVGAGEKTRLEYLFPYFAEKTDDKYVSKEDKEFIRKEFGKSITVVWSSRDMSSPGPTGPPWNRVEGEKNTYAAGGMQFTEEEGTGLLFHGAPSVMTWEVYIHTTSPRRAAELAKALALVCRVGAVRREQEAFASLAAKFRAHLPTLAQPLEDASRKYVAAKARYDRFPDIDRETEKSFRAKQWMMKVDAAGIEARIKTVDQLLPGTKNPDSVTELARLRMAAQVDLADVRARMESVDSILRAVAERDALRPELDQARSALREIERNKEECERVIRACESGFLSRQRVTVADDKIFVSPMKWVVPPPADTPPGTGYSPSPGSYGPTVPPPSGGPPGAGFGPGAPGPTVPPSTGRRTAPPPE